MSVLEWFALTDRVAIVTGASSGPGVRAAMGLVEAGADVVVVPAARKGSKPPASRSRRQDGAASRCR